MAMVETAAPEMRSFSWAAVAGWSLSVALGLAVTALGHLPALTFSDFRALKPADYGNDWLLAGQALLFVLAGGIVVAAVQWRILVAQGDPSARLWFRWTVLGWTLSWALVLMNSSSFFSYRLHQTHIMVEDYGYPLTFLVWLFPALYAINWQNAGALNTGVKRPYRLLFDLAGWGLGAVLYALLLAQSDGSLMATVLVALPVGALIGLLNGLGLRWGPAFGAWAGRVQQHIMGPPLAAPPPPVLLRPLAPLWWGVALAMGFLLTALPRLWLVYTHSPIGQTPDLWTYAGLVGLPTAAVGGAVLGLIQAAVLRSHGDPAARGWAVVTVLAWIGQWAMTTVLLLPFSDHYPYSLPPADWIAQLAWFAGGLTFGLIQSNALHRPAWGGVWAVTMGLLWGGTGLLYSAVLPQPPSSLGIMVLALLVVGGVIGVGSGLLLSYVLAYPPLVWLQSRQRQMPPPIPGTQVARPFPPGVGVITVLAVVLVALGVLVDLWACNDGRCWANSPQGVPVGAPVAWADQLRVAQDAAHAIDPAAVLVDIDAERVVNSRATGDGVPLVLNFNFYSATRLAQSGNLLQSAIAVGFVDTAPATTLRVNIAGYSSFTYEDAALERARTQLATLQIGPREVLNQVALARRAALTQPPPVDDAPYGPGLALAVSARAGSNALPTRPVWRVSYGTPYPMEFIVDAQTGAVTRRATP